MGRRRYVSIGIVEIRLVVIVAIRLVVTRGRRVRVGVGEGGAGEDFNLISIANNDIGGFFRAGESYSYHRVEKAAQYVRRADQREHWLNSN